MTIITVKLVKKYDIQIENFWTYEILIDRLCYYFNCKEDEIIINNNEYDKKDIININNLNVIIDLKTTFY